MYVFYRDLKPEYNIIDIRDRIEYDLGHYYNSVNIPYIYLLNNPSKYLKKDSTYYIYCSSGVRSKKACELLSIFGYNVINVIDGYNK